MWKYGFITITALAAGCHAKDTATSEALYSSTHSSVYGAGVTGMKMHFSVDQYIDYLMNQIPDLKPEDRDSYVSYYKSPDGIEQMRKDHLDAQLNFIMGSIRGQSANIARAEFKVAAEKITTSPEHVIDIDYDAEFVISLPKDGSLAAVNLDKLYIPVDMGMKARVDLYEKHKGCFAPEMAQSVADSPDMIPYVVFYYVDTALDTCDAAGSADWQKANIKISQTPLDPAEAKYPEIDRIWADGLFEATMIFTPADEFTDKDIGVYGYARTAQLIEKLLGPSLEGKIPVELRGYFGAAKPTKKPHLTMTYNLPGNRKVRFNLVTWEDSWQYSDGPEAQFRAFSQNSDYISYNGHAGYGRNVGRLEEWSEVKAGHYQIFYVNGCSTFGYLKDTMFRKRADLNPGQNPEAFLDVVSNISPSYFKYMPEQNMALVRGILSGKSSYLDMFTQIDKLVPKEYQPMIIVHGEDDNTFKP